MAKDKAEKKAKKGLLSRERKQEIAGVLLVLISLLILASLVSYSSRDPGRNWGGLVGHNTAWGLYGFLGFAAFIVPVLGLLWGWNRFRNHAIPGLLINTFLSLGVVLSILLFLSIPNLTLVKNAIGFEPGGWAGRDLTTWLISLVGMVGTILIASGLLFVTLLVTTEINIQRHVSRVTAPVKGFFSADAREAREKERLAKAKAKEEKRVQGSEGPRVQGETAERVQRVESSRVQG